MTALTAIVAENRAGGARGLPAWCTAHSGTLAAIFAACRHDAAPILVEATCNQVNQFGGYTGMRPAGFRAFVADLARAEGVDPTRLILGGDHLGPNPWRSESSATGMDKARAMVAEYVGAGFEKIHLDASMPCADDGLLREETVAARAADLCVAAETAAAGRRLAYVIGAEVPTPGGATEPLDALAVTRPDAVRRTVALHADAFRRRGLEAAFERVIAVVVQPGVDFANDRVHAFDPPAAAHLPAALAGYPGLAFEAHSTDYQSQSALRALVDARFAILKVGPELTFAYRQAIMALAGIEAALNLPEPSRLAETLRAEMRADPAHWRAHVGAGPREDAMLLYGLSDRVRYYWLRPAIQAALGRLFDNIAGARPEPGLVAQMTGTLVAAQDPSRLPGAVVARMVGNVVRKYRAATSVA